MDKNYISSPNDFQHMEGTDSVEFKRTFALDGTGEDESLRLYLRKAGLSDEIEYLTPDQRRAFIYDIIKSNKMPGFWMPSTMTSASPYTLSSSASSTTERSKPPPPPVRTTTASPGMRRHNNTGMSTELNYATISSNSSSSSLYSLDQSSPIVPRRFQPTPPTPPSPSTYMTSIKGSRYEISGPMNFQHLAGDMTRDRTRNAFDLTMSMNDNVLRKYMLERGIKQEDLAGMRKQDVIKNIVQSKFTWMPPQCNGNGTVSHPPANIMYATTSSRTERVLSDTTRRPMKSMHAPPPPPPPLPSTSPQQDLTITTTPPSPPASCAKPAAPTNPVSSVTLLASRFASPAEFPSIEDIYSTQTELKAPNQSAITQSRQTYRQPPPPPTTTKPKSYVDAPSPPSSLIQANNRKFSVIYHSNQSLDSIDEWTVADSSADGNLNSRTAVADYRPPPPPKLTLPLTTKENHYASMAPINNQNGGKDTPPLYATIGNRKKTPPPTPPKPKLKPQFIIKVSASTASLPSPPLPPQPAVQIIASTVPIPPPLPTATTVAQIPPPPPAPPIASGAPLPPPPPPLSNTAAKGSGDPPAPLTINNDSGEARGALLDSIRKGVALKKVDEKAATICGVKPHAERKPAVTDFLSELKMGVTLRRVKDKNQNPYAGEDPDESQA